MKDISIIVPFYNSSQFLRKCVFSLCKQTISSQLELVFVDDCSTDDSENVIRETISLLQFTGECVFVKHDVNLGSAFARKTGIDTAQGDYILFCDSDDWMELDMCEKLLTKAEQDDCDIVVCDYNKVGISDVCPVRNCYSDNFFIELLKCSITGSLCNKLIKRSLFLEHSFIYPTLPFCEDYVITTQASYYADKIGYVPEALYNYAYNPDSITQKKDLEWVKKRLDEDYENFKLVEMFMEKEGILDTYWDEVVFHKLKMKNFIRSQIKIDRAFLSRWRNTFPELNHQLSRCKYVGFRLVISYYLTYIGLWNGR